MRDSPRPNAFGNALGQGLVDQSQPQPQRPGLNEQDQAFVDAVNRFSAQGIDDYQGTDVAANGGYNMGRTPSTASMGAGPESWSKDRLRKFEIEQRNAGVGEPRLIPGTGDFVDLNSSLTKNGYSIDHDVLDSGLSKIAVYKPDGSSSSMLVDLGMKGALKDRSFFLPCSLYKSAIPGPDCCIFQTSRASSITQCTT